jgi:hypothetical protein
MMEAASTSETSVKFYQTKGRNNPEDGQLQNKNSHFLFPVLAVKL